MVCMAGVARTGDLRLGGWVKTEQTMEESLAQKNARREPP
jgi:hypothetical protein